MIGTQRKATEAEIRLRMAKAADRARLIPLINAAFAVETFIDGPRTDDKRLAAVMNKGSILVAEDKGARLVAAVYVELRGARGYLGMLAVEPRLQGKGLGRKMTLSAEDWLRRQGCKAVELTVLSLRKELPPYYRKLGYAETGRQDFHPEKPLRAGLRCHCIVMSKRLYASR
jgi:ribosomal protein S18 acetylase RimI-like enzyme